MTTPVTVERLPLESASSQIALQMDLRSSFPQNVPGATDLAGDPADDRSESNTPPSDKQATSSLSRSTAAKNILLVVTLALSLNTIHRLTFYR